MELFEDANKVVKELGIDSKESEASWILDESDNSVTCSKCGCSIYPNDILNGDAHFCPNCGKHMRGER